MIQSLQDFDAQLLMWFNAQHYDWLDAFWFMVSTRFVWVVLYIALAWLLMRRYGWKAGLGYVLAIAAAVALADQTCATVIRPIIRRLRPSHPDNPLSATLLFVNGYRGGHYGFPSCHAANTVAVATLITLLVRNRVLTTTIWAWCVANCYSRLYLGVHYPGDILAGAIVGALVGWGIWWLTKQFGRARKDKHRYASAWVTAGVFIATLISILIFSLATT